MKTNCDIWLVSCGQRILVLVFLFLLGWVSGFTQPASSDILEHNEKNFKEELFIQTDRDFYIVGEQVWFKIYKLNAITGKPDNVSKVVYLELLNPAGYPVQQLKLNVIKKSASASLFLSDTLGSGHYLLRAYTSWMKNFSAKDFSFRQISIINPFHRPERMKIPQIKPLIDTILFYPEGGVLISGFKSKVGFKAIDIYGRPQRIDGAIINEKMDTICLVHTKKSGFGTFFILPDNGVKYRLTHSQWNRDRRSYPLGKIDSTGVALSLDHQGGNSPYIIKINKASGFTAGEKSFFIILMSKGLVRFIKEVKIDRQMELVMEKNELPNGISQVVLTDENWETISHRWIYNESEERVYLDVKLNKQSYAPREKIKVGIIATNKNGNPIQTDLSVSISKTCLFNGSRMNLINRYKYNCSLESVNDFNETSNINDCLLFYCGDGFELKDALETKMFHPVHIPELEGLILGGTLLNSNNGKPVGNTKVLLSIVGREANNQIYQTDDFGDFYFVINESGLQEIVIQPLEPVLSDYYIELKSNFSNSFDHFLPGSLYLDTRKLEQLNKAIVSAQIENIYKPYQHNDQSLPPSSEPVDFYGEPEYSIRLSDYIQLTTMQEVIKEIVPYVSTRKMGGKSFIKITNEIDGRIFENNSLVLADGVPFNDFDQILRLNSNEMERIEVINRRYFIDDHIYDGIVHFITKKGNLEVFDFDQSIFRQAYHAYTRASSFYLPDYSSDSLKSSILADFRNTLFWNADLRTNNNGLVDFEFFTSDEAGKYTIFIEGISEDGKTGVITSQFIVN